MKKKLIIFLLILSIIIPVIPVMAKPAYNVPIDFVDIGDPSSETGHNMASWGPIEPATSGGNWGGFGVSGDDCRVVWEPGGSNVSRVIMRNPNKLSIKTIEIRALDGIADDSFTVYYKKKRRQPWKQIYQYTADPDTTEKWVTHTIQGNFGKKRIKLKIKADGASWTGHATYGQLGIDWVETRGKITSKKNTNTVKLKQKDPVTWLPMKKGGRGKLKYDRYGSTFYFKFNGWRLQTAIGYSLIYYADPWPGTGGALIGAGVSDSSGKITISGNVELNMDIPNPSDANYPTGGKVWLVLTADYDAVSGKMIGWNPSSYMFEEKLIVYDDLDL